MGAYWYVVYHGGEAFAWVHWVALLRVQKGFRPVDCTAFRDEVRHS